jgi:hypothetical protein
VQPHLDVQPLHSRLTLKHCAHNLAFLLTTARSLMFDCEMLPLEASALVWYA